MRESEQLQERLNEMARYDFDPVFINWMCLWLAKQSGPYLQTVRKFHQTARADLSLFFFFFMNCDAYETSLQNKALKTYPVRVPLRIFN